jgi:stage II sporulation protein AA (anti-sigma F factor antagonist)
MTHDLLPETPQLLVQVVSQSAGKYSVTGHGEIDIATVGALVDTIDTVVRQERPRHLDVNLAEVAFMDSSGLNALVQCSKTASAAGCQFTVSQPRPLVRRLFEVTGLLDAFGLA